MAELCVTLRSEATLTFTSDRGPGDINHSLDFVPGSALRGALAKRWLAQGKSPTDEVFRAVFIEEGVQFGNLYPVQAKDGEDIHGRPFPVPLSARTCKYWKGFRSQPPGHGVQDILYRTGLYHLGAPVEILLELDRCSRTNCRQPLDRFDGFAYRRGSVYRHREASSRLIARVAIDRLRGAAADGILYSLESLDEDQEFEGRLMSRHPDWLAGIQSLGQGAPLRLGVAKTRGLGLIRASFKAPDDDFPMFSMRVGQTQIEMESLISKYSIEIRKPALYFSLTLDSDAVVPDAFFRYQTCLDSITVASLTGISDPEQIKLLAHFSATRVARGWNAALGIPKVDALALTQGSSFLYAYTGSERDRLQEALKALEEDGIGIRRGEGYGRIIVCHPFHEEVQEHV